MRITEADLIKGVIGIFTSIMIYTEPIHYIVLFTFACVLVDTITGICKAKKLGKGITSSKYREGLPKILMYAVIILLFLGLDYAIGTVKMAMPMGVVAGCIVCACEIWSILENCTELFPNEKVFVILKKFMNDKAKEVLHVDLECDNECNNKEKSVNEKS